MSPTRPATPLVARSTGLHVDGDDRAPSSTQPFDGRPADPRRRPGDERDLPLEALHARKLEHVLVAARDLGAALAAQPQAIRPSSTGVASSGCDGTTRTVMPTRPARSQVNEPS